MEAGDHHTWNSRRSSSTHEMIVLDSLWVTPETIPVIGSSPAIMRGLLQVVLLIVREKVSSARHHKAHLPSTIL